MQALMRPVERRFIRNPERGPTPAERSSIGLLEGYLSTVVNLVLAAVKLALGVMLQSAGLISDAVHSLSDMATSLVVILGFHVSRKPPDPEHPFGHAKAEYVATLVVAILLIVAGFELGLDNVKHLLSGEATAAAPPLTWLWFGVLVLTILAKEGLALFSNALGRLINSSTLAADGWHHRTDAISTGLVILGLLGRNVGVNWLDGAAGAIVSGLIMVAGIKLAWDSVSPLLGESVDTATIERMRNMAIALPEIRNVHDFSVHRYGHFYFTTLHVEISDTLDPHQMHEVTVLLETRLLKAFPGECVIHVDPLNLSHPLYHRVSETLKDIVVATPHLVEFRDLNLWHEAGRERGEVEISPDPSLDEDSYTDISADVRDAVQQRYPQLDFDVHIKVDFSAAQLSDAVQTP